MATPPDNERQAELVAYLDGELDKRAAQEFERCLGQDAALRSDADALKRTWELLDFLPQPEPSPMFTTRTLDKVAVLRPAHPTPVSAQSTAPVRSARILPWALGFAAAAALLFLGSFALTGALGRKTPLPEDQKVVEEQMAKDLRVLDNLTLYQYGDDLAFVLGLDQPDLFGEETGH